ncbi:MAG: amidohydrolase [Acidobacteriota bacterium]|nr:amidohydrolase [Acidobacteriota bacterium]
MTTSALNNLPQLLDAVNDDMVNRRHDLHAHPELSFQEFRTTEVVTQRLRELGWELFTTPTPTGAIAKLRGARPGQRVMLRADIDALPVHEERDLPYRSRYDGVMHACGHDVHTAALLGVADLLARYRDQIAGEYTLVFQPAEEGLGGARAMIEGGIFDEHPVDYGLGVHVTSLAPVGVVATRPGVMMSEACAITVTLRGAGGHGAMAVADGNVVLAVSALAPRLGEVVDGLTFEGANCACSAGVLSAGTANNVVPRQALLRGTIRTFTDEQVDETRSRLSALLDEIAQRFAVTYELSFGEVAPAVRNDPFVTEVAMASARAVVGDASVLTVPPASPSDDVSEFWRRVPGCYLFVGGAGSDGTSGMHHSPDFFVDDGALRVAAGVLTHAALTLAEDVA